VTRAVALLVGMANWLSLPYSAFVLLALLGLTIHTMDLGVQSSGPESLTEAGDWALGFAFQSSSS